MTHGRGARQILVATAIALVAVALSGCAFGETTPATDVTETSATLNGNVRSNLDDGTVWWFAWGETTAYGRETPHRTVVVSGERRAPGGRDADRPPAEHDVPLQALRVRPRASEERRLRRGQDGDHGRGRELPRRGAGGRPGRLLAPRRGRRHDGRERDRHQPRHLHERRDAGTARRDHGRSEHRGRPRRGRRHGARAQLGGARADGRPLARGLGGPGAPRPAPRRSCARTASTSFG